MTSPAPLCRRGLKDPFSGISHYVGAGLGLVGLVALLWLSWGKPAQIVAFSVYGALLVLLYLSSAIYHTLHTENPLLQRFDHVAIYGLIVGTYIPICVLVLHGTLGYAILAAQVALATVGIVAIFAARGGPKWLRLVLYVTMGWMALAAAPALSTRLPAAAMNWLLAGGIVYTVGCVVYATKRPRLWPGKFGSHDLWHVFVLAGSVCHFVMMLLIARGA